MAVVQQSLTYVIPLGLQYSLLEHVCEILNSYGNSKFPHSSPHIVLNGTHNGYDKFPGHLPISFGSVVQSRENDIVPQTGIVVGITSNSTGSQKVYFPSYDGQQGATILHRKASELTVITSYPREWSFVSQVIPIRGPVSTSCHPSLVPSSPITQPILNPLFIPPPSLSSLRSSLSTTSILRSSSPIPIPFPTQFLSLPLPSSTSSIPTPLLSSSLPTPLDSHSPPSSPLVLSPPISSTVHSPAIIPISPILPSPLPLPIIPLPSLPLPIIPTPTSPIIPTPPSLSLPIIHTPSLLPFSISSSTSNTSFSKYQKTSSILNCYFFFYPSSLS